MKVTRRPIRVPDRLRHVCFVALLVVSSACGRTPESVSTSSPPASAPPVAAPSNDAGSADRPQIVMLGDSLTAGYGLPKGDDFPSQLQKRLNDAGYAYRVVNMGVSGDTSAGGLRRLDWSLEGKVAVLVVALGGNDGLRGLPPTQMEQNLRTIVERAVQRGARVLLCGMEAPPNLGDDYTRAFHNVFPALAREKGVALVPFLLEGVAGIAELNQGDGIHPNAEGARRVADLVWRYLEPLLKESGTR